MTQSSSASPELTRRYAKALIDLAQSNKTLTKVEKDIEALTALLNESTDFQTFIKSESIGQKTRISVIAEVAKTLGLQKETENFVNVISANGRLKALGAILAGVTKYLAEQRGELTAQVETVFPLTQAQQKSIAKSLSDVTGRKVKLETSINEDLVGGIVITVGSVRVDGSIEGRLDRLKTSLRKRDSQALNALNDNIETVNKKEA